MCVEVKGRAASPCVQYVPACCSVSTRRQWHTLHVYIYIYVPACIGGQCIDCCFPTIIICPVHWLLFSNNYHMLSVYPNMLIVCPIVSNHHVSQWWTVNHCPVHHPPLLVPLYVAFCVSYHQWLLNVVCILFGWTTIIDWVSWALISTESFIMSDCLVWKLVKYFALQLLWVLLKP